MFVQSWLASLSRSRRRARRRGRPIRKPGVRRGLLEKMEDRCLLAGDWHNAVQPADVNGDELVTLTDLLAVVGDLRVNGQGALPPLAAGGQPAGYFDASNDGVRSVADVVLVINALRDPASVQVALSSFRALSNHYFAATFNRPARGQLLAAGAYTVLGPDGSRLPVLEVFAGADPNQVILATAAQQPVDYTLQARVSNALVGEGEAVGSTNPEPWLQTAIATSSTTVLLTFSDPMEATTAQNKAFYRIAAGNDAAPSVDVGLVRIESTVLGANKRTVILTTTPMENIEYSIKATNVINTNGSKFIDPTRNITTFFGIPHSEGLRLVSVASTNSTTILLSFSERIDPASIDLSDFVVTHIPQGGSPPPLPLVVTGYELDDTGTQITLTTFPQPAGATITVMVNGLLDIAGMALPPTTAPPIVTPVVQAPPEEALPRVVGAAAINNTTVIVAFSRPMGPSALDPLHYVIAQLNQIPEAGALVVLGAEYLSDDNRATIKLTTLPQNELAYTLTVVDVRDETGQPLAPPSSEHVDPTRAVFPGTPHSGPAIDSDGDGLPDSEELRGWLVTIVLANGTVVERGVTSDSMRVDTDEDGVPDSVELARRSDPRDADTDDDELPDAEELNDRRGDPTKQDTDNDGLTDLAEKIGWTINVTLEDGTVVNQQVTSNPYLADTDFDGLLDFLEQLTQVDPRNPDSDGDGASDGDEVLDGQDPATSDPGDGANDRERDPRVVGAASLSNTTVLVSFSEAMADNALTAGHYFIVQQNVNPEVGFVPILSAVFNSEDRRSVLLTTASQNELTYAVTALNVTDLDGNALAPAVLASNQRIDPTTALFPGTPPSGVQIVDSDGDGLSDNIEVRGWVVNVTMLDGSVVARQVTSNPGDSSLPVDHPVNVAARDADGDGLPDAQELNIGIDPRAADTDGDQLNDYAEFNEIYSDPTKQDTDGDALDDFLEFAFFKTSAVFADSDGDQIDDGDEILGNRNARVSDLPRPEIEVGAINLQLDVRFSESSARESRDLETKSVSATLSQSESKSLTRQFTGNVEAHLGNEVGFGDGSATGGRFNRTTWDITAGFTFQQTEESTSEMQRSFENSFSTEQEVTAGFTVQRDVVGAVMQATVNLRNVSNLAYRVKNLQVTAFIQDPQDHSRLTPVATLLPDNEPEEGFTLGPFVTNRGPLIFSNNTIVPRLVESLMANSSGLIFRISNYDIINEDGRNFAFVSQDVVERTGQLVIDFGGARSLRAQVSGETIDENLPGDETEIHRVSTSAGQVIDTNFDGAIDDNDRPATFDATGKEVGITLFEALAAAGLEQFEARLNPGTGRYEDFVPGEDTPVDVSTPTEEDRILNSYSTYADETGRERIFRIRGVANDLIIEKYWEILTPLGIDQQTELDELILKTGSPISLNFVQDLDGDLLPADVEFLLRTSDTPLPFGALQPGATDLDADAARFNTDPGLATGTLIRVADDRGGLTAGTNYFVRNLGGGAYTFHSTAAGAGANTGRVDLTDNITTGVFRPISPTGTNTTNDSVTFDPALATATQVRVIATGGGLIVGTSYFLRNLGGGSYSFYNSAANANAGTEAGRIDLTGNISGVFAVADPTRVYYPTFTDFTSRSITFDPRFATATLVNITTGAAGLMADTDYFLRHLSGGSYSFHATAADALAGENPIDLTGAVTSGVFSPTAHGRDTDRDGLDDRFEALIGWTVSTPLRTYTAYSSPNRRDSNFDTPKPGADSDSLFDGAGNLVVGDGIEDRLEFDGSDGNVAPAGWDDKNNNALRDRFEAYQLDVNDLVLDAIRKDTDGDGINDATELIGFLIEPIDTPGSKKHIARTDPNHPFTDSDTFTDGFEKLVGLDPTDGSDTDEDGDGLPDRVELISGWLIRTFEISETPFEQGDVIEITGFSRTDSVDSDDDGLTDYEEFFLKTNAELKDTDGDGIDDRIEYLGYALGHEVGGKDIGIIKTDPLDADTDNDLRSDGDEAELVDIELDRWVVRVAGAVNAGGSSSSNAYQVWSHPLVADADFDSLVDGQEFFGLAGAPIQYRTDPNNANTDGDKRDDGVEVRGGMNPLAEDIRVTVVIGAVEAVGAYGRLDSYDFSLKIGLPGEGPAGLREERETFFEVNDKQAGRVWVQNRKQAGFGSAIKVFYQWRVDDSGPINRTAFEPTIPTDGGPERVGFYDPGAKGVPVGAQFRVAYQDAGGFEEVAPHWHTYSGNETAALGYQIALDGVGFRIWDGNNTNDARPPAIDGWSALVPAPGFANVDLSKNIPLATRSITFGLANEERFSIEGTVNYRSHAAAAKALELGGLEGERAFQEGIAEGDPEELRSVFSKDDVASKFIEDYYFEEVVSGVTFRVRFYYIIG